MKKFIVTYHSTPQASESWASATPEQKQEGMKAWMDWKERSGNAVVDFGAPLVGGTNILKDGNERASARQITGYSIIQANDLGAAKNMLKDHPHLVSDDGNEVEVHETVEMSM